MLSIFRNLSERKKIRCKKKRKITFSRLIKYAGNKKWLLFTWLGLSAVGMVMGMMPYICIWLVVRDLTNVAPDWTKAENIAQYGWLAFTFALENIREIRAANQQQRYLDSLEDRLP